MAVNSSWIIDPGHSEVQFKIRHLAVSNVTGRFRTFEGEVSSGTGDLNGAEIHGDDDFNGAGIHVVLDAGSLDTNNPQRDGHLKSPDFINVEKYPSIRFDGSLQKKEGDDYVIKGELTIREETRSVKLDATLTGTGVGRFGDKRAGFEVKGKIRRSDFGLTWNILAEGGGLVVGEEITLFFDIQLMKKALENTGG